MVRIIIIGLLVLITGHYLFQSCDAMLSDPETKEMLTRKFDLLILDGAFPDCAFSFVHTTKAPFMYINTVGYYMGNVGLAGTPSPFSVTPVLFGTLTDNMSFIERIQNFAMSSMVAVMQQVSECVLAKRSWSAINKLRAFR